MIRLCKQCNKELFKRENETTGNWKKRIFCNRACPDLARVGKTMSLESINKIKLNRKGKGIGNKNGKGKNIGNQSAKGKVSGEKNGNWKGGTSNRLGIKEKIAGRLRPEQCEICGAIGKICFDHDHKTGLFRGWICSRCNLALGLVNDNEELLISLSEYLYVFRNKCHKKNINTKQEN